MMTFIWYWQSILILIPIVLSVAGIIAFIRSTRKASSQFRKEHTLHRGVVVNIDSARTESTAHSVCIYKIRFLNKTESTFEFPLSPISPKNGDRVELWVHNETGKAPISLPNGLENLKALK